MMTLADKLLPVIARALCAGLLLAAVAAEATPPVRDVRILVDVSGSMRHTDPDNLRVPALRLLTGLIPGDARAGVWTFGRHVNMLVPHGPVDEAWRDRAAAATREIPSIALYTNIEGALETATWNWHAADAAAERHLILFTDGMVDLPDGAAENARSRGRITESIAVRLRDAGVRIHAVALSDETDEPLLRQLAAATGGLFEKTTDAAGLERLFARIFARAVESASLPLLEQRFLIDDSIRELTILAFREEGTAPARLTMPDGAIIEAGNPPRGVRWHSDLRYDLVTINEPQAGTWEIDAALDPDSRIMVVSDLRLEATRLPTQLLAGDRPRIEASISDGGRTITRREFLHFVRVEARWQGPGPAFGEPASRVLLDNGRDGDAVAGDGIHTLILADGLAAGSHALAIEVDGTTFRRAHRQTVEVVASPVINGLIEADGRDVLVVIPRAGLIEPDSLRIHASITGDDGATRELIVPRTANHEWRLDLGPAASGEHRLALDIEARRPDGSLLRHRDSDIGFGRAPTVAALPLPATAAPTHDALPIEAPTEALAHAETDWAVVGASVVAVNLVLLALMWLAWRRWIDPPPARSRTAAAEAVADVKEKTEVATDKADPAPAAGIEPAAESLPETAVADTAEEEPESTPSPFDEEIVLEDIKFDDLTLDFDDEDRKRGSG